MTRVLRTRPPIPEVVIVLLRPGLALDGEGVAEVEVEEDIGVRGERVLILFTLDLDLSRVGIRGLTLTMADGAAAEPGAAVLQVKLP